MRRNLFNYFARMASCSIAVVGLTVTGIATPAEDPPEPAVTGRWRITTAVDAADIASLDEREAARLVGLVVEVEPDKVVIGTRVCHHPTFEAESVEPRLYLREEFRADASDLHLPNPVTVVKLACTSAFIKAPGKILIFWKGWFFDAVRTPAVRHR